jgi:hypothetical protein
MTLSHISEPIAAALISKGLIPALSEAREQEIRQRMAMVEKFGDAKLLRLMLADMRDLLLEIDRLKGGH